MKIKMILFLLAMLIAVAGKTNAQDLKALKILNTEEEVGDYDYIEKYNLFLYNNDYNFKIINPDTKELIYKSPKKQVFKANQNNYYLFNGGNIIKYNPLTQIAEDTCELPADLSVIQWNISENGNYLIGLGKMNGVSWWKTCAILVWDPITCKLVNQFTYNMAFVNDSADVYKIYLDAVKISSNAKYCAIEWQIHKDEFKYYEQAALSCDIINLNTKQQQFRKKEESSITFSETGDTLIITKWYFTHKGSIYYFECLGFNMISSISGDTLETKNPIIADESYGQNRIIGNNFFTTKPYCLYKTKLNPINYSVVNTEFQIGEFKIHKNLMISRMSYIGGNWFAFYDISTLTEVFNENNDKIIYPNPTTSNINIELDKNLEYQIQIINNIGAVVNKDSVKYQTNYSYNTTKLTTGIYFLQLRTASNITSYKFIKE